ncbi:MAG: metallophosphoesterase [Sulfolobales archaeon]
MKVLALSDVHGNWRALKEVMSREEYDVVLIAGDLSDYGGSVEKVIEIISDFIKNFNIAVYSVLGNMDNPQLLTTLPNVETFKLLHGSVITHLNYLIIGFSGGLRSPFHTNFELSDSEYRSLIGEVVKTLHQTSVNQRLILLTHTPPYNTKVDLTYSGLHVGSEALREFIESYKPMLTICGHIHEGRGVDLVGNSLILNPGPLFRGYYATIDLNDEINYELKTLK